MSVVGGLIGMHDALGSNSNTAFKKEEGTTARKRSSVPFLKGRPVVREHSLVPFLQDVNVYLCSVL